MVVVKIMNEVAKIFQTYFNLEPDLFNHPPSVNPRQNFENRQNLPNVNFNLEPDLFNDFLNRSSELLDLQAPPPGRDFSKEPDAELFQYLLFDNDTWKSPPRENASSPLTMNLFETPRRWLYGRYDTSSSVAETLPSRVQENPQPPVAKDPPPVKRKRGRPPENRSTKN